MLRHILEHPEDDAARLVYADWLEEHGAAERSEFIRVQIELATLLAMSDGSERVARLQDRARQLLLGDSDRAVAWDWMGQHVEALIPLGGRWEDHVTFRRGFVAEISCTLAQWVRTPVPCRRCKGSAVSDGVPCRLCGGNAVTLGHGPAVCESQPVECLATELEPAAVHFPSIGPDYLYSWDRADVGDELFAVLGGLRAQPAFSTPLESRPAALARLSRALINQARAQAWPPLPPLP